MEVNDVCIVIYFIAFYGWKKMEYKFVVVDS